MIESFKISNFKCFRELELPRLTRLTVIGGRNGVGKTALLEALFMFFDRLNPNVTIGQYARRGVPAVPLTTDSVFAPIFPYFDMSAPVRLSARISGVAEDLLASYNPAFRPASVVGQETQPGNGVVVVPTSGTSGPVASLDLSYTSSAGRQDDAHLLLQPKAVALAVDRVMADMPRAVIVGTGSPDPNLVSQRYGEMDVSGTHDRLIEPLRAVEPRLKGLSSVQVGNASLMHADVGMGRKLPVAFLSEGFSRLLSILVFIGTCRGGLVLVDEIENGVHHSAARSVWGGLAAAVREFDCQLVVTTHSYACIESAAEGVAGEFAEDLSYVRLERREGAIIANTYDRETLDAAIAHGLEVR